MKRDVTKLTSGLPLADAASLLGLSVAQMRRRVLSGRYPFHRDSRGRIIVDVVPENEKSDLPLSKPQDGGATVREFVRLSVEVERLRAERAEWSAALTFYREHQVELAMHIGRLIEQLAQAQTVIAELTRAIVKDRQKDS